MLRVICKGILSSSCKQTNGGCCGRTMPPVSEGLLQLSGFCTLVPLGPLVEMVRDTLEAVASK